MEFKNTRVYGLSASIIASGYPMCTECPSEEDFLYDDMIIRTDLDAGEIDNKDIKRVKKLGNTPIGAGHDCFAKGIIVQTDMTAPQYIWMQWQRYHFHDIISSQSKMHRITEMNISDACNVYVDPRVIAILKEYIVAYKRTDDTIAKKRLFHRIIANTPSGFNLTARITTNYLQLKTMHKQRKNHAMFDWSVDFVKWVEELPHFKKICLGDE